MCTYCICKPAYVFNIDMCLICFYLLGLSKDMTSQATLTQCYPIRRFDHGLTSALNSHCKPPQKATHLLGKCYIFCYGQSVRLLVLFT